MSKTDKLIRRSAKEIKSLESELEGVIGQVAHSPKENRLVTLNESSALLLQKFAEGLVVFEEREDGEVLRHIFESNDELQEYDQLQKIQA